MRWDMSGLGTVLTIYGCVWFGLGLLFVLLVQYVFGW